MSVVRAPAIALLCAAAVLVGCGQQTLAEDPEVPLATAGTASGLLLAHGTVVRGGEPLENATVVLQAMPVTSAADIDGGAQRWSAPAATTDARGQWQIRVDPTEIPEEYYPKSHSFLEFDLVFGDGAGLAVWRGTVYLRTRPDLWRTEGAGPPDGVLRVDVDLESGEVDAIDSRGEPIVVD